LDRIAVVIPCHGRERLAERVIEYHTQMPGTLVLSVWTDTQPLGKKFNEGFLQIKKDNPDIIGAMIVGSDDLIHEQYFRHIRQTKPLYSELARCLYYNGETGDMRCTPGMEVGAGKYFSRAFLDRCDYKPYVDELDRNVDRGPKRFLAPQFERLSIDIPWIIDIKGPESMWGWDHAVGQRRTYEVDAYQAFKEFGLNELMWKGLV